MGAAAVGGLLTLASQLFCPTAVSIGHRTPETADDCVSFSGRPPA